MSRYYLYCKKADFKKISELFHISPMLARILRNRDLITEKEIDEYLNGGTDKLYDPFQLKGMEEAVPLLFDAIRNNRKIRIIGDYDTDGVCSSYILKSYLNAAGGKADIRLPNRMMEGYGMNAEMVEEAFSDGIELILTCDNGVSSYEAVQKAKEKGIPVIVSDHHEVPEPLIDSEVVIDAKQPGCPYPFKELCGAGVAYKIVSAMNERIKEYLPEKDPASYGPLLKELLVFAGIATIADVVPLIGENRIIAKEGIRLLKETTNQGLKALIRSRNLEMDRIGSFHIGFIIAPCINSAGRLKDAEIALELFEETDEKKAEILAEDLSRLNEERKEMTASQTVAANQYVQEIWKREESLPKILVIFLPDAHESIAGIIAGRLKEDYARPVLVLTNSEEGIKGSGRSVTVYPMIEELRKHKELFSKLGGHAKAAGFTLAEGVFPDQVADELNRDCSLTEEMLQEKKWIDIQLPFPYVTEDFIQELDLLEPFGLGNEPPVFAEKDVRVRKVFVLGKNNNVLKLELEDQNGYVIEAIRYGSEEHIAKESEMLIRGKEKDGDDYRIAFTYYPAINEFRGNRTVQLRILDFI